MTKKTRLIILLICIALFLVVVPYIILYSVGYRVDFGNQKIVATGGIYVQAYPTGVAVAIDNGVIDTTGYFNNSVFVQNLLPGTHHVSITKEEYHGYQKNLLVQENEVTKLENVTLFKKDITFLTMPDIPKTATTPALTAKEQFASLIEKPAETPVTEVLPIPLIMKDVKNLLPSLDNQKIAFATSQELFYLNIPTTTIISLGKHKNVKNLFWLNNDYLIFSEGEKIVISEIDVRGNINTITLSETFKTPQLFFNQEDKKLYVLSGNKLEVSDRLLP